MCKLKNKYETNFIKKINTMFLLSPMILAACATTNKGKIIETMVVGAAVGAIYGQSRSEFKNENALMYGAIGGLTGSLIGLYHTDPDKKVDELQSQLDMYKKLNHEQAKEENLIREKSLGSLPLHEVDQLKRKGWREQKIDGYFQVAPNFIYHSQGIITPDEKYLLGDEK